MDGGVPAGADRDVGSARCGGTVVTHGRVGAVSVIVGRNRNPAIPNVMGIHQVFVVVHKDNPIGHGVKTNPLRNIGLISCQQGSGPPAGPVPPAPA